MKKSSSLRSVIVTAFVSLSSLSPNLALAQPAVPVTQNVTTYMFDHYESGINPNETILTPENVKAPAFGQLFTCPIDGQGYAQPLYLSNVTIAGKSHNVVFVATMHDSVYAFDADAGGEALWHVSFITPDKGITTVPTSDVGSGDIQPEIGILSTPVIDEKTGTIYVVAKTKEIGRDDNHVHYVQKIHALDVATGAEKFAGPKVIGDLTFDHGKYDFNLDANPQTPSVPGTAKDGVNGKVYFNAYRNNQRCSLTLYNGIVYVGWSSHGDTDPYHGWLVGFDASTLAPVPGQILCSTPDGLKGGIWQGGAGPTIDNDGNLFISVANAGAPFCANQKPGNVAESFLKFNPKSGLTVTGQGFDFFAPHDAPGLGNGDSGVGSGGLVLMDVPGPTPHLAIAGGKNGILYIVNRDSMGHFDPAADHNVQTLETGGNWVMSSPVFFNNCLFYCRGGENLKGLTFADGKFTLSSTASKGGDGRGGGPVISAHGTANAILWLFGGGNLMAFRPDDLAGPTAHNGAAPFFSGHLPDGSNKFTHPIVINGKVYAATSGHLTAFGLLPDKAPAP